MSSQNKYEYIKDNEKLIKNFGNLQVLNGRFGPYISFEKENYKLPKNVDINQLSLEDAMGIINSQKEKSEGDFVKEVVGGILWVSKAFVSGTALGIMAFAGTMD